MRVYRSGQGRSNERKRPWKSRARRVVVFGVLLPVLLLLVYLFMPFWQTRTVLLGSDARADEVSRSDTILVGSAGWGSGMVSVPRDTRAKIPGFGMNKINAAYAAGGPDLMVQTLEQFMDLPINNYVILDFDGVEDVVNAMGGIEIDVNQPIDLGIEGRVFHIDPGRQTLRGGQALAYVRYRGGPMADIGRINRQQIFLSELKSQAVSLENLHRLPSVLITGFRNIETNMGPLEMFRFAVWLQLSGTPRVETYPGVPQYIGGISYWVPDKVAGQKLVENTLD